MCGSGGESGESLTHIQKGHIGCEGLDGMRKIKTKKGCVCERVMGEFRDLNVEVRGHCSQR